MNPYNQIIVLVKSELPQNTQPHSDEGERGFYEKLSCLNLVKLTGRKTVPWGECGNMDVLMFTSQIMSIGFWICLVLFYFTKFLLFSTF